MLFSFLFAAVRAVFGLYRVVGALLDAVQRGL
jgi:hypothetical protein